MIKNYLKVAFRNLLRDKVFSAINIFGLALGIASFLLITKYISFEKSYESFIPDRENIYRVSLDQFENGELRTSSAENYPGVGPAFADEFPEVESFVRLYNMGYKNNVVITYQDAPGGPINFKHRSFMYADSAFLPLFGYPLVSGDALTALAEPNKAAISESYAKRYFGDEPALGKMLRLQDDDFNDELVEVTAVFEDLPDNTHLKFDVLFSYKTLYSRFQQAPQRYGTTWGRKDMYIYVKLRPDADIGALVSQFPAVIEKYNPGLAENNREDKLALQRLEDIHLYSALADEPEANGDYRVVNFLQIIAAFILLIAWVNYINLSTSKAMERAGEVGVRKVMGAFKSQLIRQFLAESAIVNFCAIVLAAGIIALVLPQFNQLADMAMTITGLLEVWFVALIVAIWAGGTLLSGMYPAFVLSSFKPVVVLKGKLRTKGNSALLRKALVVFQFAACVALIAGTLVIYEQLNYMKSSDLGMNIEQVLVVERPGVSSRDRAQFTASVDAFRNSVAEHPSIQSLSGSITIPGKKREYKVGIRRYEQSPEAAVTLRFNSMDYDFVETFGMNMLAGREFSPEYPNDGDTSVILSESAVAQLGFESNEEALGKTIAIDAFRWNPIIVGVVNDYHQEGLHKPTDPIIFYNTLYSIEFYSMKIDVNNIQETISHVEASWEKAFPGNPFQYFFLDDFFNRQYNNEEKFGNIFGVFAILAIVVGGLGLFALSAFTAEQRTKEIGVRKVLGSSVSQILLLLIKSFVTLLLIANIIAWPITWFLMDGWLEKFAYRIDLNVLTFLLSGLVVLVFAIITISYQTLKAARVAPVRSLRYE